MKLVVWSPKRCLGASLLGMLSIASLSSYPRKTVTEQTVAAVPLNSSAGEQHDTAELFSEMTARHHWQETHLDRFSVTRTYKVENDKNKILAEEAVVMKYRAPGTETFTTSSGKGSEFILHHVFQRLIKDEVNRIRINKDPDSLITPGNYILEVVGTDKIGSFDCLVVSAVPKRKETDLFEGKIWIDSQDFAIAKITGRLAKSPSFWIKQVDFIRDYKKIDGFWLLSKENSVSSVRIFGNERLTVDYQNYSVNGSGALQPLLKNVARGDLHHSLEQRWLTPRLQAMGVDEKGMGFHAFRRFRKTWLRGKRVQEDINNFWMGHAPETMSETYSRLDLELDLRLTEAESMGVGFTVPSIAIAPNAPSCSQVPEESDVEFVLQL